MLLPPLNGAFGRLLCKFGAILAVLFLFGWFIGQRQRMKLEKDQLEGRLQFAQEQLSSLHAQIDVVTRHKEKIETLLEEERAQSRHTKNELSERIDRVERENARLLKELARLNQTRATGVDPKPLELAAAPNLANPLNLLLPTPVPAHIKKQEQFGIEREQQHHPPKPIGQPEERLPDNPMEHQRLEELEQREEDPFAEGGDDNNEEKNVEEEDGGKRQIEAPKRPKQEEDERHNNNGNGNRKEQNGGEKMAAGEEEDYVFKRPRPRADLIFHRGGEVDGNGSQKAAAAEVGVGALMPGKELMRKLAEKEAQKQRRKKEEEEEQQQQHIEIGPMMGAPPAAAVEE